MWPMEPASPFLPDGVPWICHCDAPCSGSGAAQCLYVGTLELLSAGLAPAAIATRMVGALARVVAEQRTARGHGLCREYAAAVSSGMADAALDACRSLIELAGCEQRRGWDDLPGHI